ncbi:protein ECERIFERUM 26 [Tripterygium wilfordii]|uniref:Protein ECERIFERUM 26 n=1 Tax=Tripterygium wilfordii TaxID=458696 RepID=A0A7J7DPE5_TRIWF|nr:protein ECERIFERUM 26 [Tripterygium wilfordii]KAF5748215.1 protein ECERIFERUM 26 [Tripterygium wilfordii]
MSQLVTHICKRTVVSTKPVQPGKYYQLSVLDQVMEQNHIRIVYYYGYRAAMEAGETIKKLRESLAEMLTWFPMATGRLQRNVKGDWMIKCNDAGVRMIEARAKGSVEEWLRSVDGEKELELVHWEDINYHKPYFWSPFYVQVTEFEQGGLAIGLSCTHFLVDLTCATMFIKAWADTTLTGDMLTPPVFHELPPRRPGNMSPAHKPYTDLINHYKSCVDQSNPATDKKYATIALSFTDTMVQACIDMAQAQGASPSPFEALAGLFWVSLSNLKRAGHGLIDMSIGLDMRKVLGLDKGFFGNCMVYNKVHANPVPFKDNKLSGAAKAIGEVVAKMDNEGIMDLIEWLELNNNRSYPMNGCDLNCVSLEGLDPYSACFEQVFEPVRVSYYIEPVYGVGQVLILPSAPGEGPLSRVVLITLLEDDLNKVYGDKDIQQFSPSILMGMESSQH